MSHIATGKSQIRDLDCLRVALQNMGLTLQEGGKPRYYGTRSGGAESFECEYVVPLPGMYDLGLKLQPDGTYAYVCDTELLTGSYGRGKEGRELLGENAERLVNEYIYEVARTEAAMNNYSIDRETDKATGEQVIYLSRY